MDRLLWIGSPGFAPSLPECGWSGAHVHNPAADGPLGWEDLVNIAGFDPDALVVAVRDAPPHVLGVESFPCLTILYSLSGSNNAWQTSYAQAFDACLVSRLDHLERFQGPGLRPENIWWSPPFATANAQHERPEAHSWDCLLIDQDDAARTFLGDLAAKLPGFRIEPCHFRALYPRARLLLHYTEDDVMDSWIFDAMARGNCILTPRVADGLGRLFVDGEHLVIYAPRDAGDAAYRAEFLLRRPELCEYIASTAQAEIMEKHMARHRAEALTDHLCDLYLNGIDAMISQRQKAAPGMREAFLSQMYLSLPSSTPDMEEAFKTAARGEFGR